MKFFKPEDFIGATMASETFLEFAARLANMKINHEQREVYFNHTKEGTLIFHAPFNSKGQLINIEPIEKCTHSSVHVQGGLMVSDTQGNKTTINPIFQCTDCQKQVYPIGFKES